MNVFKKIVQEMITAMPVKLVIKTSVSNLEEEEEEAQQELRGTIVLLKIQILLVHFVEREEERGKLKIAQQKHLRSARLNLDIVETQQFVQELFLTIFVLEVRTTNVAQRCHSRRRSALL